MDLQRVAVIGAGYMGGGIAQTLALAGRHVFIADADAQTSRAAHDRLIEQAHEYERGGLIERGGADTITRGLHAASSLEEAAAEADYITEAVPEDLDVKLSVLGRISGAARVDAIIGTNTSAIRVSTLASAVTQTLIGVHWFNPAPFVPLVEITGIDERALQVVEDLLIQAGKIPVRVPDVPGFLANRLQLALYREAVAIVDEGLATPGKVDQIVSNSFGYRLPFFGPFAVGDIAGLDVYVAAYRTLEDHYGPRFSAPKSLTDRVAKGNLGVKAGGGFLATNRADRPDLEAYRDRAYVELAKMRRRIAPRSGDE